MELAGFDFSSLVPIGSGIAIVIVSVRLMVWVIGSMQNVMARNDELSQESFEKYKATTEAQAAAQRQQMEDQRQHIDRIEQQSRELEAELHAMRMERVTWEAERRQLNHRIQILETRLGITAEVEPNGETSS